MDECLDNLVGRSAAEMPRQKPHVFLVASSSLIIPFQQIAVLATSTALRHTRRRIPFVVG